MNDPDLVTVQEAAKLLKVHHETLRKWLREGILRGVKISVVPVSIIKKSELLKLQEQDQEVL